MSTSEAEKANEEKMYAEMSKFDGAKLEAARYPQVLPTLERP